MGEIAAGDARAAFATFDIWTARAVQHAETSTGDIVAASAMLRHLDLALRTPDALNIAIAQRLNATLATYDEKMAASARALGTQVAAV